MSSWYQCALCDAGYEDQRCTCAIKEGNVSESTNSVVEQEKAKFNEFSLSRELENFKYVMRITHQDGSVLILNNSCLWVSEVLSEDELPRFIGVATEHLGHWFFFVDDLTGWSKLRPV